MLRVVGARRRSSPLLTVTRQDSGGARVAHITSLRHRAVLAQAHKASLVESSATRAREPVVCFRLRVATRTCFVRELIHRRLRADPSLLVG